MALDEPKDDDATFDIEDFKFVINSDFLEKAKPVKVDFQQYGFKLDCGIEFGSGCGSCSTEGSCCA